MSTDPPIALQKFTWYKSRNGQRFFVIVGHWYANDPEKNEVEILELYQRISIKHSRKEMERLISSGEIVSI
jgi:hypothetical protein